MTRHNPIPIEKTVAYVMHLQAKLSEAIGHLPRPAVTEYAERGQIIRIDENDDQCGYLLYYDGRKGNRPLKHPDTVHIHQAAIQYDAQRMTHGADAVQELAAKSILRGFDYLRCWVADDLPANLFWHAIGFHHIASRLGGDKRSRVHRLWLKKIRRPAANKPTPDRLK